ncbi:DUF4893 domain-containing protein [Wenxinia saemankumensis]|uniref:DUF4893 domain-containing protein n=1 Tax=Wenxinia saemankumensis TaxID=1447782 RepID=A0A1M6E3F4_9RHOB|nr:DUF4893 domain-containing protein [Wenxinia saemankumensis]SHI80026.1 protein of unknown function [Wenxinia saemankumensis]
MRGALVALALVAAPVAAQELRPADAGRLAGWETSLGAALHGALAAGAPADVELLVESLSGVPGEIAPEGDWSCRTIKMGELSDLVVYAPFACRITAGEGGWRLEKLTGSQRMGGTIHAGEVPALYTGTAWVDGGPATDYAGLPPEDQTPVEPGQTVAQVGWFEQAGPGQARLLLPDPILESRFDILWLTR